MFREATAKIRTLAASPFLTSLAINGALFLLFFLFFTPAYETTDDSFMMTIASGEYTGSPSEYLVFINTLFGFLLKFLYTAMPHLNWYPLLMYLLHFWAMVSILYVILSKRRSALCISLFLLFFATVEIYMLNHLQFTTTAFVAGSGGLCLLFECGSRRNCRSPVLAGLALLLFSSLIRLNSYYLLLLLAVPALIYYLIANRSMRPLLLVAASLALAAAAQQYHLYYYRQDPQWNYYQQYTRLRSYVADYPYFEYSEHTREIYEAVGWSENDVEMFRRISFADTEVFSLEDLEYIVSHTAINRGAAEALATLTEAAGELKPIQIYGAAFFLAMAILFLPGRGKLFFFFTILIALAALLFFAYRGRLPVRILLPILYFVGLISLVLVSRLTSREKKQRRAGRIAAALMAIVLAASSVPAFSIQAQESKVNLSIQENIDARLAQLRNADYIYVIWSGNYYDHHRISFFRRPPAQKIKKVYTGGWYCHSPNYYRILEELSIGNIYLDLLTRDDMLLLTTKSRMKLLVKYIQENYHIYNAAEPLFEIDGNVAYKLHGSVAQKIKALPQASQNIRYNIDKIDYDKKKKLHGIRGWAVIPEKDTDTNKVSLVLASEEDYYLVATLPERRPDVTAALGKGYNYDHSGFQAWISPEQLTPGSYTIGLLVEGGEGSGMAWTPHVLAIDD